MPVLTRIKNNQITDATITGTKMVDQTITSNLFAANLTLASNITVLGNFQVTGTPTSINSINTYINDPLVVYNNGYSGSLSGYDIGILINRNLAPLAPYGSVNTAFVWVEDDKAFEAIATTETGAGVTSINRSGFANVKAGNVTTETITTGSIQAFKIGNVTPGSFTFTDGNIGGLQVQAIGNVSPGTGAFTTLTTTQTIISTGNIVANSGTASTSTTLGALVVKGGAGITGNINVGGEWSIVAALQNTVIGNISEASGKFTTIQGTDVTNSTNTSTGAMILAGGASIAKDLWVGGNVYTNNVYGVVQNVLTIQDPLVYLQALGNLSLYNYDVGFFSDYTVGSIYAHTGLARQHEGNTWVFFSNIASEPAGAHINWADAGIAYDTVKLGELIVANTTATTSTTTGALRVAGGAGIAGNLFVDAIEATSSTAYVYDQAVTVLNIANSGTTTNIYGVTKTHGNLVAASGVNSSSPTTGAINISNGGGLGVTGNVYFDKALTVNASKTSAQDVVVKGANDETLLWVRPSSTYDSIIVGNNASASTAVPGAKFIINTDDTMIIPVGTNATRPSSTGKTDVIGMFRYNDTLKAIEWYDGEIWGTASTNFTIIAEEQFNGDGSTTVFTLSAYATTASLLVSINGVLQIGGASYAYTVSNDQLTFTQAPSTGDIIDCRILTTTTQVTGLASTLGFVQIQADDYTGIVFISQPDNVQPIFSMPVGGGLVGEDLAITVASANVATQLDSFSTATYRSAKYLVQVTQGTDYQVSEALVIHNGTTATVQEYGVVKTNGNLGLVTASIASGNVKLNFVGFSTSNSVRLFREYLKV